MAIDDLLPKELRESDEFRADSRNLVSLDDEALLRLRHNLPSSPQSLENIDERARLAGLAGLEVEIYSSLASFAKMLLSIRSAEEVDTEQLADYVIEKSGVSVLPNRRATLIEFFGATQAEDEENENSDAFYFGDSYISSYFKPLMMPVMPSADARLGFGGNLSIMCTDATREKKVFSVQFSYEELCRFLENVKSSVELLDQLKHKYKSI